MKNNIKFNKAMMDTALIWSTLSSCTKLKVGAIIAYNDNPFQMVIISDAERLQGHIVSPAPTTERLQSIQRLVADQLGDKLPDFEANALHAIPVQVGLDDAKIRAY